MTEYVYAKQRNKKKMQLSCRPGGVQEDFFGRCGFKRQKTQQVGTLNHRDRPRVKMIMELS